MLLLRVLLLVLHIAAAAVSFGAPLGVARLLRRSVAAGDAAFALAAEDARRRVLLARVCGVVALFSGVALIFVNGGFGAVPKNYHTALLLMWGLLGVQFFVTAPAIKQVSAHAGTSPVNAELVMACARKIGVGVGVGHGLWTVILYLMFQRF